MAHMGFPEIGRAVSKSQNDHTLNTILEHFIYGKSHDTRVLNLISKLPGRFVTCLPKHAA